VKRIISGGEEYRGGGGGSVACSIKAVKSDKR